MYRGLLSKNAAAMACFASFFLISCGQPPVSGFAPIYPVYSFWAAPKVDSLQPTLIWEPVPGRHDMPQPIWDWSPETKPFIAAPFERIRNVRYDLKIWRMVTDNLWRDREEFPEEVVYERKGIEGTSHKLLQPLEPDTWYVWSVRARFELDGKSRVSEWSLSGSAISREKARRTGQIPLGDLYRLKTPSR